MGDIPIKPPQAHMWDLGDFIRFVPKTKEEQKGLKIGFRCDLTL